MGRLLESKGLVGDPMVGSSPRTRWCGLPPGPWVFPSRPLLDPGNKKTNKLDPEGSGRRKTQEMPGETPTYLPMGAPEGTGISSNLVLELLHGLGAQWSPVGEGVPEMTRLEKIPWEGEFTLRSDS